MDRLAEIKMRHYPNGDTHQMIADFEWLIDEVERLRSRDTHRPNRAVLVSARELALPVHTVTSQERQEEGRASTS
jgi:hypothetical protein